MRVGLLIAALLLATPAMAQTGGAQATPPAGPVLVFETEKGTFEIETYPSIAPKTVEHIVGLVQKRFYNGLRVHRVVDGRLRHRVLATGGPRPVELSVHEIWGVLGEGESVMR